tara:strand:- start:137 stop:673 length:537 start_codon:yes stop_codon:yes gene_type:complete
MNKRADIMGIVVFFIILFVILFAGFIMVTGSAVMNWVFDEAVPELDTLGVIEDRTNMTEYAEYTLKPLNSFVQSFTWMTGVLYILMLVGAIAFAVMIRTNPSRWLIGFYFLVTIMLIMGSIFISNMYEEFYAGTDELATRLQEHVVLSVMILQAPVIFTVISFIVGIILFSGIQEEVV